VRAKLIKPLDFLVIADHALYYGLPIQLSELFGATLQQLTVVTGLFWKNGQRKISTG
jgi:hypothetical protein